MAPDVDASSSTKSDAGGAARIPSRAGDGLGFAIANRGWSAAAAQAIPQSKRRTSAILRFAAKSSSDPSSVPAQIAWQPLPELKSALTCGPVAPRGRDLGHPQTQEVRLHCQLDAELEAPVRLDRDLVEQPL